MANKCPTCHSDNPDTLKFCGECGTPLPPHQGQPPVVTETLQAPIRELTTGSTFAGRYQVIEELGHGGMGRVYKVFDADVKEKIALKLLRPEIALDKDTVERFSNELKLARKISHRNVCRMFDLGKAEGTTFITMEFVPGEDLKKFIRKSGQLGAGRAVSIVQANMRRPGGSPSPRGRPPRPEAPEHHGGRGRERPDHGLRDRPVHQGQGDHRRRSDDRHAGVHVAGAGRREGGRPALGYLFAGGHPLRDGDGSCAVRGGHAVHHRREAQERAAAEPARAQFPASRGPEPGHPPLPGEGQSQALSDGGGTADRPRKGRAGPADDRARYRSQEVFHFPGDHR